MEQFEDTVFPEPEDYVIRPCGQLYGKSCVSIIEGKFVGEFGNDDLAEKEICRRMKQENFYPNVWIANDRDDIIGNRVLDCRSSD